MDSLKAMAGSDSGRGTCSASAGGIGSAEDAG